MTDDWSLKEKVSSGLMGQDCIYMNDIETLHNKIINDIDVLDCTETSKFNRWELIEEVFTIIDKYFGID